MKRHHFTDYLVMWLCAVLVVGFVALAYVVLTSEDVVEAAMRVIAVVGVLGITPLAVWTLIHTAKDLNRT